MALEQIIRPSLTHLSLQGTIIPGMFGLDGDTLFIIIVIIGLIVLTALIVTYATKAMQMRIALERELRTTAQLEAKVKIQDRELTRLKKVEDEYKTRGPTLTNLYANPAYGETERSSGNYGEVECYQHYETIPKAPIMPADDGEEGPGKVISDTPAPRAAVATAVPVKAPTKAKGDFVIQDVFVIYRDGRLVTHLSKKVRIIDDSDIIGSMITAVQTFVRESFRREAKGTLDEMKFGEIRILMEYGDHLNIALVIRGHNYDIVKPVIKEVLETLHNAWKAELSSDRWNGNLTNISALERVIQKDMLDRFDLETFHRSDSKPLDLSKAKVFSPEK